MSVYQLKNPDATINIKWPLFKDRYQLNEGCRATMRTSLLLTIYINIYIYIYIYIHIYIYIYIYIYI